MEFRFIDNSVPLDRHAKSLVRKHAMKGKNLGRVIPARGHRGQQRNEGIHLDFLVIEPKHSSEHQTGWPLLPKPEYTHPGAYITLPPNPFPGSELSYFTSLIPLTPTIRHLFYECRCRLLSCSRLKIATNGTILVHYHVSRQLYPGLFCQRSKNETVWFERVIEDPCGKKSESCIVQGFRFYSDRFKVFHCAMAVTRARISKSKGQGGRSSESTRHFLLALRLLRRELSADYKSQDSIVVVVVSLAIYAIINGSTRESRIHLEGLKRILESRTGGLAALRLSAPEVHNKICRADLELALLAGTSTLFRSQPLPLPDPPYVIPVDVRRSCVALPHPLGEAGPVVHSVMMDVLAFCNYAGSAQLSAFQYQDLVISIQQRLVDYSPLLGERPSRTLDDICQLGLLAFMSTVLNHTRDGGPACSTLLSDLLRARLERFNDEVIDGRASTYPSFHLWLIFIYTVSTSEYEQGGDAHSSVARCMRVLANTLALGTWEGVAVHLRLYPWVAAIHDEPSKRLWAVICT